MHAQIVGNYAWYAEFDDTYGEALYHNAQTHSEAIAAAVDYVRETPCRVSVRCDGRYLAEVRRGWRDIIVEIHEPDGSTHEHTVPSYYCLVASWLRATM